MASMGKRHTEINERTILEIHYSEEGYKERIIRPQVKSTTQYICASAIAPNGTSFAYSLHGGLAAGTIAIVGLGDDRRKFSQELSACTAMQFTHDSRYLIAAKGDYIADGPIFIYIISAEGKLIGNYYNSENYDNGIAHNICVTPDNRFLVFGDKFECQILDMISMKTIGLKDVRVNVLRYYSLDLFPYWAIHPNGSRIYVSSENELHIIHLPEGQHTSMLNDKFVLCFSPDGKFLFEKDVLGNLYRRSLITGEEVEIQKSIYHVIPSLEGRYLYIVCKTMEILFCDYNGRILQKAYSNDCIRFKLTARGLAIAQDDGRILLFAPDEKYKANIPAIAWSVRSWNLEIKEQEEKKIICPLCGHVIKKDVIGDLSCENCAALIHVVL